MLAATFGLGTGSAAITLFTTSILAPRMVAELGWSRADYAMLGTLSLITAFSFPIAGRLADLFGVKRTVVIGIIAMPIAFLAYSMMTGPIWQYIAIHLISSFLAITTTTTVYTRIAVQYVEKARGLALAIVASGPAVLGAIGTPFFNALTEAHGWRTGYHVLAVYAALTGIVTLLLLPPEKRPAAAGPRPPRRKASEDYPQIFRTPVFWVLIAAMLACNLPQIVAFSQLKLVLIDNGVTAAKTSPMLAAFPVGMLLGRFIAGLALDRYPPHLVGFFGLSLPGIGLLLLASAIDTPAVLIFAVLCLGFSVGAEGDIIAYAVARLFGVAIYSSVMGLMTMAISFSVALGAALLSVTLARTGGFDVFLLASAGAVFTGSLLFLTISRQSMRAPEKRLT